MSQDRHHKVRRLVDHIKDPFQRHKRIMELLTKPDLIKVRFANRLKVNLRRRTSEF